MGVLDNRFQVPNGTLNGVVVAAAIITRISKDRTRLGGANYQAGHRC